MGETDAKLWRRWTDPVRWLMACGGIIVLLASTLSSIAWARLGDVAAEQRTAEGRLRAAEQLLQRQEERGAAIFQRLDRQDRTLDAILDRLTKIESKLPAGP